MRLFLVFCSIDTNFSATASSALWLAWLLCCYFLTCLLHFDGHQLKVSVVKRRQEEVDLPHIFGVARSY